MEKQQRLRFFGVMVSLVGFLTTALHGQQQGSIDPTFNAGTITIAPGSGLPTTVDSMLLEPDGKIYIAGDFNFVSNANRIRIARLLPSGRVDSTFNPGFSADGTVNYLARITDGKLLVAGNFTNFNGVRHDRIARLSYDGNIDPSFHQGSGANANVHKVLVQPDGKLLIAGNFTSFGAVNRSRVARLNDDGTLDQSFDPGTGITGQGLVSVGALAFHQDQILIGGSFTNYNGNRCTNLIRVSSTGTRDESFAPFFTGAVFPGVYALAVQSDGKILVGGNFHWVNAIARTNIARLNSDGTLDLTFQPGGGVNSTVRDILIQNDGKILIAGPFSSVNGVTRLSVARLNEDGTLDTDFVFAPTGLSGSATRLQLQNDGKLLIGGSQKITTFATPRTNVMRLVNITAVTNAPSITSHPQSQTALAGANPALSVIAEGYPLHFSWFFNETPLPSGTNAVLSLPNVTTDQNGSYFVVVSNALGVVTSAVATLTVEEAPPTFVRQPLNLALNAGASTNLSGQALGFPFYQWFQNGSEIANATNSSLPLLSVTSTHAGNYWLVASNLVGTSISRTAVVTVTATPAQITTQPTNQTVLTAGKARFTSGASGSPPPILQWRKNGADVPGATSSVLSFAAVTADDAGNYQLIASNFLGAVTSQVAVLQVLPPQTLSGSWYSPSSLAWSSAGDAAWITQSAVTFAGGDAAQSANTPVSSHSYIETEVVGPGVLSFWWKVSSRPTFDRLEFYHNGDLQRNISGETDWQEVIVAIAEGTNQLRWRYSTSVSPPMGQNRGWLDQVSFNIPSDPIFTTHPKNRAVLEKGYVQLQGHATGAEPLLYQWLWDGSIIPGATNQILLLTNFSASHSGIYTLRAENEFSSTFSSNAVLTMRPLVQSAAMQVLWRKAAGSAPWLPVEADHSYRGIAFNPLTTNVLVVSRYPSVAIHVLDGNNGDELGKLQIAGVISGGTFTLNMIGVAEDGTVYAANLTISSRTSPLKIYRWENDSTNSVPTLVWSGDPGDGTGAIRWGDTMDVRGAGANTELLFGSGASSSTVSQIGIIRPADGINSPAKTFNVGSISQLIDVGFGAEDTIWYKVSQNLYHASSAGDTLSNIQNYTNSMSSTAAFAVNMQRQQIARLIMDSPDYVQLSELAFPALKPLDTQFVLHPLDYTNSFQVGSVVFKADRIYAINANNGIIALKIRPRLQLAISGESMTLNWDGDHILQSAAEADGPFEDIIATSPHSIQGSEQKRFFRLRSR